MRFTAAPRLTRLHRRVAVAIRAFALIVLYRYESLVRRAMPKLWFRHRNYALLVTGLLWAHTWAALDELLPDQAERHQIPVFRIHNDIASPWLWGAAHVLCALGLLVGVYGWRDLALVRVVAGISSTLFVVLGTSFAISIIRGWPQASLLGIGLTGFLILACIAVATEPSVQPANAKLTRRERATVAAAARQILELQERHHPGPGA